MSELIQFAVVIYVGGRCLNIGPMDLETAQAFVERYSLPRVALEITTLVSVETFDTDFAKWSQNRIVHKSGTVFGEAN